MGLNRCPHKIESLGTTSSTLRSDRTRQSGWPDSRHPASGRAMHATWPLGSTSRVRFQRSKPNPRVLSCDRTRCHKDRTCRSCQSSFARVKAEPWPDALLHSASPHQISSREVPEPIFLDRTRQVTHDWTRQWVRSPLARKEANVSVRHLMTGRRPCMSGHFYCAASDRDDRATLSLP
jgi:hypothetical protein